MKDKSPYRYTSHFSLRHLSVNLKRESPYRINLALLTATLALQLEPGITEQIHLQLLTATLVCQLETGIVVVVGANLVVVAETVIQHANTSNELLVLEMDEEEIFSSNRHHPVPNRIVSTVRRAESTTTRHRDAATLGWQT